MYCHHIVASLSLPQLSPFSNFCCYPPPPTDFIQTDNVIASLSTDYSTTDFEDKEDSLLAAVWLSIICGAVETIGLLGGFSMFLMANNVFCK